MGHITLTLVALFILTFVSSPAVRAHEGHDHKILGTVTMAAADHLMLKDRDGKEITVQVGKETKVRSDPAMKVEDIKPGTRVVVTATMEKDKTLKARTIQVGTTSQNTADK